MNPRLSLQSPALLVILALGVIACASPGKNRDRPAVPAVFPEGAIWEYSSGNEKRYQKFFAGGGLLLIGSTISDNRWYQTDSAICFSVAGGYAIYQGEFVDPQTIRGTARDRMNHTWDFEMALSRDPVLAEQYAHRETWEAGSPFPPFTRALRGPHEIRIKNPNPFSLITAIRGAEGGIDFNVPARDFNSVFIPAGAYEIYFTFSGEPDVLYRGDDFFLSDYGFEIEIAPVTDGNYSIHKVR
jgi:hypothetical protein